MRIKSYFAPSVQAAIALARREFGDDVTLVTSHVASAETRHLGEYEVVFAVDAPLPQPVPEAVPEAPAAVPQSAPPQAAEFQAALRDAMAAPPSTQQNLPERLDTLRTRFIELGIEPAIVRALMTLIERSLPLEGASSAPSDAKEAAPESVAPEAPLCPVAEAFEAVFVKPEPLLAVAAALPDPAPGAPAKTRFSAAELAFISAVSSSPSVFAAAQGARS